MKTLKLNRFKKLTKTEQVVLTLKEGELRGERSMPGFSIKLFCLGDFFVELWYSMPGKNIIKVQPVSGTGIKKLYPDV